MSEGFGEVRLVGAQALQRELERYPRRVRQRAERRGVVKAAQLLRRELRAAAPRRSGLLRRALRYKKMRKRRGDSTVRYKVGLRRVPGESKVRFYYKTLEFGRKGGPPLNPFVQRVVRSRQRELVRVMIDETRKALITEARRVHQKTLGLK